MVSPPVWCAELAAAFWRAAGPPPPFPRDLTDAAAWFGVTVVTVPALSVAGVADWFRTRGVPLRLDEEDRGLRGCLVAWRGEGFAFLDPGDDPAERRFTLAHELGHFLRDYWKPRDLVRTRVGEAALAALDGDRPPTAEERLKAVLRNAAVGPFAHLLARDDRGRPATAAERAAEDAADRLAYELLAPAAALADGPLAPQLGAVFGLPVAVAGRYAALLRPPPDPPDRAWARLFGPTG